MLSCISSFFIFFFCFNISAKEELKPLAIFSLISFFNVISFDLDMIFISATILSIFFIEALALLSFSSTISNDASEDTVEISNVIALISFLNSIILLLNPLSFWVLSNSSEAFSASSLN